MFSAFLCHVFRGEKDFVEMGQGCGVFMQDVVEIEGGNVAATRRRVWRGFAGNMEYRGKVGVFFCFLISLFAPSVLCSLLLVMREEERLKTSFSTHNINDAIDVFCSR